MTQEGLRHTGERALSVILTAFNRRQFLRESLRSAVQQSLPAHRYEVLVLANFELSDSDLPVGANNVRVFYENSPKVGQTLARGLREATGRVVTFLDDDDLYQPDRLARVLGFFERHGDLGYYHNAFSLFTEEPRGTAGTPRRTPSDPVIGTFRPGSSQNPGCADAASLLRFLSAGSLERNLSSAAISRALGLAIAPSVARVEGLTDTFLLFAALSSPGVLAFDSVPLTMVRRHPSNTSKSRRDLAKRRSAWEVIEEVVHGSDPNPTLDRYLRLREARSVIFDHLVGQPASRRELWLATETVLRSAPYSGPRKALIYSALGMASAVPIPGIGAAVPLVMG
jgi:hypothetical protein